MLHGFYPDPLAARRALDGIGTTLVEAYIGSTLQRDEALVGRLAKMIGVRSARHLAGRAMRFYGG